eukprot:TRINITY_DN2484_c0_g4_i1.p1 TRINITY_DN2484_c0_g4~~TRINITY_DN2484_c0_g4_i1.p1  ORF type:complete len:308 (-),score=96.28 TRINITY_DN2484_c0_g4_i1:15-938(-)
MASTPEKTTAAFQWEKLAFAGVGCVIAGGLTNPIDVAKVRLQLQGESSGQTKKYTGILNALKTMKNEEGIVRGWGRGMQATLMREASYSSLRLGMYDPIKDIVAGNDDSHGLAMPLWKKIAAGGISGALSGALANPFDLIKVRQQGFGVDPYKSVPDAFGIIVRKEKTVRALWKGTSATVGRAMLVTATQVPAYDQTKHMLLEFGVFDGEGMMLHFAASMIAGVCTATTTSPVDVIKTRIMSQPVDEFGKGKLYRNALHCGVQVFKTEGIMAFFKGWNGQWLRIGPHTIISFVIFEQLRSLFGIKPI